VPVIESAGGRIKLNPLAHWSAHDMARALTEPDLPRHPLWEAGYDSIGCAPCTEIGDAGGRSGRWAGREKTECGIHLPSAL